MWSTLRVLCFPSKTFLEETEFSFASGYQSEIASAFRIKASVFSPFGLWGPIWSRLWSRPCAYCLRLWVHTGFRPVDSHTLYCFTAVGLKLGDLVTDHLSNLRWLPRYMSMRMIPLFCGCLEWGSLAQSSEDTYANDTGEVEPFLSKVGISIEIHQGVTCLQCEEENIRCLFRESSSWGGDRGQTHEQKKT